MAVGANLFALQTSFCASCCFTSGHCLPLAGRTGASTHRQQPEKKSEDLWPGTFVLFLKSTWGYVPGGCFLKTKNHQVNL